MENNSPVIPAKAGIQLPPSVQELDFRLRGNDETGFARTAARLAGLTGAILGWRPGEFWAATPAEVLAIFEVLAPPAATPPTSVDLDRLKEQFPDG